MATEIPVLDCSSVHSAVDSFARIVGTIPDNIRRVAERVVVNTEGAPLAPEDQVALQMGIDFEYPPTGYRVKWFHATRVPLTENFSEGLLPTPQALPKLWAALGTLATKWLTEADWANYQDSFLRGDRHYSEQYCGKARVEGWEGPFAFSNRAAATGQHGRAHSRFTAISETASDICDDFKVEFGHDLRAAYTELARPCLVVFVWPEPSFPALRAAANFIFRHITGLEHGKDCNAVFRGRGTAVPAQMIERLDWLEPEG